MTDLAKAALERFANSTADQAATGRPPIANRQTLGVPFEQYDQIRLKSQLEAYVSTIRGNAALVEELACDLIAALAFVNSESGINCFEDMAPQKMTISVRQLGDIFYLAIKTSRYLQFLAGMSCTGQFSG